MLRTPRTVRVKQMRQLVARVNRNGSCAWDAAKSDGGQLDARSTGRASIRLTTAIRFLPHGESCRVLCAGASKIPSEIPFSSESECALFDESTRCSFDKRHFHKSSTNRKLLEQARIELRRSVAVAEKSERL